MSSGEQIFPVAVYTRARKFPKLIGKFPNGQEIPGGPYTRVQVGVLITSSLLYFLYFKLAHPTVLHSLPLWLAVTVAAMIMARRIGFAMARPTSRLLWLVRPHLYRAPLSTGGRTTQTSSAPVSTGEQSHVLDLGLFR